MLAKTFLQRLTNGRTRQILVNAIEDPELIKVLPARPSELSRAEDVTKDVRDAIRGIEFDRGVVEKLYSSCLTDVENKAGLLRLTPEGNTKTECKAKQTNLVNLS